MSLSISSSQGEPSVPNMHNMHVWGLMLYSDP